jgi:DNA-binding CsgD family transcriptional regulator
LFGYIFLYRQGFFNKNKKKKLLIGGLIIIIAIASQLRITGVDLLSRIFHFVGFMTVILLTFVILRPEIQVIRKKRRSKILVLPPDFKEKDAIILRKILIGTKYEVIANEEKLSLSTLKKQIRRMFYKLEVGGRYDFLLRYVDHKVVLTKNNTEPSDAQLIN